MQNILRIFVGLLALVGAAAIIFSGGEESRYTPEIAPQPSIATTTSTTPNNNIPKSMPTSNYDLEYCRSFIESNGEVQEEPYIIRGEECEEEFDRDSNGVLDLDEAGGEDNGSKRGTKQTK